MKKSENVHPTSTTSENLKKLKTTQKPRKPEISYHTQSILSSSSVTKKEIATSIKSIINIWEKATGHKIKNPEANVIITPPNNAEKKK